MEEEEISADPGAESAEDVCKELGELDVDTKHVCALVVAADRIEITAEFCPSQKDEKDDNDCETDNYADFGGCRNEFSCLVI